MHEVQVGDASNAEAPLYGYVLENILCHVPLVDLLPASHVAKTWNSAVLSSLNNFNKLKPWLIVHSQSTRAPYSAFIHAYDPRSHVWVQVSQSSIQYTSILRSSHSDFLYLFSSSKFLFTIEPFHPTWQHVGAPRVWRVDPIVARVNDTVIIAGGTFVMKKSSCVTHWFDPKTQRWSEPLDLLPDNRIFYSLIAFSGNCPILIGLIGTVENVEALKIYKANIEGNIYCGEEIGEMPLEFIEKLKCESYGISAVSVCVAGDLVYFYNEAAADEVVVAEALDSGGGWRWWSVKNEATRKMSRMVFTCAQVGVDDLQRVTTSGVNQRFTVKDAELTH